MFGTEKRNKILRRVILSLAIALIPTTGAMAGGGMVLSSDICIIQIDFYSVHFTAYQPNTSGNTQFCRELPDTGDTIIVLDYLHQSLQEVPVDFRIIRDVTGQGRFVKLKHVEAIEDIEQATVFYQPPIKRPDASLTIEYDFPEEGQYIGIISAGHPSNDMIYTAVFPFKVGGSKFPYLIPLLVLAAAAAFFGRRYFSRSRRDAHKLEAGA